MACSRNSRTFFIDYNKEVTSGKRVWYSVKPLLGAMRVLPVYMVMMLSLLSAMVYGAGTKDEEYQSLLTSIETLQAELETLKGVQKNLEEANDIRKSAVKALARQVSQQQLYVEEMTRSSGDSGLKLTRLARTGSKAYMSTSYVDERIAAIHNHPNYKRLVGLGEFIAVLNGVEFRTRHNDYKLKMPSKKSMEYGATEDIPYPDVPPAVLEKGTLEGQIEEMQMWFKAWRDSNYTVRDYRPYFKANLCYLEGMWTNANATNIEEPFESNRHSLDADSFFDLQQKIRYSSATGTKDKSENFAYLPSTIADVDGHGNVKYSQWNYNILCHPIRHDIPLTRFRLEEDLGARIANGKTQQDILKTRAARFTMYEDSRNEGFSTEDTIVTIKQGTYLDKLMKKIPGKDNYKADIQGHGDKGLIPYDTKADPNVDEPLNVGFYHNAFKMAGKDAMGVNVHRKSFGDSSVYFAYNTQAKITPVESSGKVTRVSYAIPLEIVYTTPLNSWNPYNLSYSDDIQAPVKTNRVDGKNRNGGHAADEAYYGISEEYYYMTPTEFFESPDEDTAGAADTGNVGKGVLDQEGNIRNILSSGIVIQTANIPGCGPVRTRYPIMPIHDHGNNVYKDLAALTDMTLKKHKYEKLYPDVEQSEDSTLEEVYLFETNSWHVNSPPGDHVHTFEMTRAQVLDAVQKGKSIGPISTSTSMGHDHELLIFYNQEKDKMEIKECDRNGTGVCWDGHKNKVVPTEGDFPRS